jgi:hypothetical protein
MFETIHVKTHLGSSLKKAVWLRCAPEILGKGTEDTIHK